MGSDSVVDRIYPHRFLFDGSLENEYYYIVDCKISEYMDLYKYLNFVIFLESNWGNGKRLYMKFQIKDEYYWGADELSFHSFEKFNNTDVKIARSNANHLFRFTKETWEDRDGEEFEPYRNHEMVGLSINKLYESS